MSDLLPLTSENWRERRRAIEALAQAESATLAQGLLKIVRENHHDLGALNAALQLLRLLKTPVTAGLVALLGDPDPETRTYAAMALGETYDAAAIPPLLALLTESPEGEPDLNVRFNAIEALGKLRAREAVEPILGIARKRDFFLAFPAIRALGEIGDPRPAQALAALLEDELLSAPAVEALGTVGDAAAIPAIAAWLESPLGDPVPAVLGLTTLVARLQKDLGAGGLEQGGQAAGAAQDEAQIALPDLIPAAIGPQGRAKLLAAVPPPSAAQGPIGEAHFLPRLARVLGWLAARPAGSRAEQAEVLNALARLLAFPNSRRQAAEGLAAAGKPALPALLECLAHPSAEVTRTAAQILLDLADPESLPALFHALDAEDEETAVLAGEALGKIGRAHPQEAWRIYEAVLSRLGHASARVRRVWGEVLVALGRPDHPLRMRMLLQDGDEAHREAAVYALRGTRDQAAAEAVLQAALDPASGVRLAAIEVLPSLDHSQARPVLARAASDPDPRTRALAVRSLAGEPVDFALPLLHDALRDPDAWVRRQACHALGAFADPASLPALTALVHDPAPPVRIALAEALIKIGGEPALEIVRALLADPEINVHQAIQSALGMSADR